MPPLVGIAASRCATLINRRAGTIVFAIVVAALATAFVLALLRTFGVDRVVARRVLGAAGRRRRGGARRSARAAARLFVSYLAVANLAFLGSFLFLSPTSELIAGGDTGDVGEVVVPTPARPGRRPRARRVPGGDAHARRRLDQRASATRASPSWRR